MKTYNIAGIKLAFCGIDPTFELIMEPYLTSESATYFMQSRVVDHLEMNQEVVSVSSLLKVHEDEWKRTHYHFNKQGELITKIIHSYDYKQVDIEYTTSLGDKLAIRDYITTGIYFFEMVLQKGLLPLHAAAIAYQNEAILFSAPSQTGKSTQSKLWQKAYPEIEVINDDKPILSCKDQIIVYGSPWSGKNYHNQNSAYPLKALFFLEQGPNDEVIELSNHEKIVQLIKNTHRSINPINQNMMLTNIDFLVAHAKIKKLVCTPTIKAVEAVHKHLYGESHES